MEKICLNVFSLHESYTFYSLCLLLNFLIFQMFEYNKYIHIYVILQTYINIILIGKIACTLHYEIKSCMLTNNVANIYSCVQLGHINKWLNHAEFFTMQSTVIKRSTFYFKYYIYMELKAKFLKFICIPLYTHVQIELKENLLLVLKSSTTKQS